MSQSGLRHAATEPDHLDAKRERSRRGVGAGRAAALRRAPSDSDCSAETASLSADSADRVRPVLVPSRTAKARSRRRGSEWEVLEGLKDGQRFERRPEVFNGYLHKKRKWPLKGWHKRFFVVDGGILVYARSPTDVARGRLHGSVDVGLSVISAKARRRRIDIDADEFIYHLRAKTPDVFRTWLNVLKAHRLYRQHLLTFGAREPVPKIHAPLEELPPADTSTPSSSSSLLTGYSRSSEDFMKYLKEPLSSIPITPYHQSSSHHSQLYDWNTEIEEQKEVLPLTFETLEEDFFRPDLLNRSLCSMNCLERIYKRELVEMWRRPLPESIGASIAEKQLNTTELEKNSLKYDSYVESPIYNYGLNSPVSKNKESIFISPFTSLIRRSKERILKDKPIKPVFPVFSDMDETPAKKEHKIKARKARDKPPFFNKNPEPTTTFFLFAHKKNRPSSPNSQMKRSKKSTNLVKYRNCTEEPTLEKPFSHPMLLKKFKNINKAATISSKILKVEAISGNQLITIDRSSGNEIVKINNETQASIEAVPKKHQALQAAMTAAEYDKITELLVLSIFADKCQNNNADIRAYVNQMVKELYDVKINQTDSHPVKTLFRSLLEYWLKNSSSEHMKNAIKSAKSVITQSINVTKDKNLSAVLVSNLTKETQIQSTHTTTANNTIKAFRVSDTKQFTQSFMKERRIQELEKLLKSTVYTFEAVCSDQSKEKDIQMTKRLLNNLESHHKSEDSTLKECQFDSRVGSLNQDSSGSSEEYSKIKETVERLISETSMTPDCVKEFLGAYLKVLRDESNTQSSDDSKTCPETRPPSCEVQTDAVQKKVSVGVYTIENNPNCTDKCNKTKCQCQDKELVDAAQDSGQKYLKDVLDKVTTIFGRQTDKDTKTSSEDKTIQPDDTKVERSPKDIPEVEYKNKILLVDKKEEQSVVIDLTKYDLEQISMYSDPTLQGSLSITLKLKERSTSSDESEQKNINLNFSEDTSNMKDSTLYKSPDCTTRSYCQPKMDPPVSFKNPYIHYDPNTKEKKDVNSVGSASDATSKAFRVMYESQNSTDFLLRNGSKRTSESQEDRLSYCVTPSMRRKSRSSIFKAKNKFRIVSREQSAKSIPRQEIFNRTVPTIDENFIILLLENLTLLSQNVPGLYKEMSVFYLKLKKKHERERNSGLGLLGKIYNNTNQPVESMRQGDSTVCPSPIQKPLGSNSNKETGNNTNEIPKKVDQATSVIAELKDAAIQCNDFFGEKTTVNLAVSTSSNPFNIRHTLLERKTTNIGTSSPKWLQKVTRNCAMTTALRSILNSNDSCSNFRFANDIPRRVQICEDRTNINENLRENRIEQDRQWQNFEGGMRSKKGSFEDMKRRRPKSPNCAFIHMCHEEEVKPTPREKRRMRQFNAYPIFTSTKLSCNVSGLGAASSEDFGALSDDVRTIYRCSSSVPSFVSGLVSPTSVPLRAQAGFVAGTPGGRLANWIVESGGPLEVANRELGQAQLSVQQLQRLLDAIELAHHHHDTDQVSLQGEASPNVKKDRRKFGLRKKKSNSKCASVELAPALHVDASASHTALSALTAPPSPGGGGGGGGACSAPSSAASLPIACAAARPQSLPGAEALGANVGGGPASLASLTPDQQLREDFTVLAKDLVNTLKGVVSTLVCERGRLRAAMDTEPAGAAGGAVLAALRTNLTSALQQNSELRSRLCRIHDASDLHEISSINNTDLVGRPFQQSLSYSSSCVSASEFFDAEEHEPTDEKTPASPHTMLPAQEAGVIELDGDSSSEAGSLSSEEGDPSAGSSDNSDGAMLEAEEPVTLRLNQNGSDESSHWRRRSRLPCPRPTPGGPSLWNLLYKNIGKDLSQVSMPVTINEPLNMLQRLCEELEYCELLEQAADAASGTERAALVAAFAVSAYAATATRAASKPFNPLLHETYECVREDRGFKFLAEQVSHHPPISACHAEGRRWVFWQEARIKTKFWGKSMEFQPAGRVHVRLLPSNDHYSWNKVTTCVHNLFGGQRWVDQYGDMHITCHGTSISAKLNFIKASSWSSSRHEVRGAVVDEASGARLRLAGRWSEALYAGEPASARLLWRSGVMPPEHELYYGFTRFAMELNEMEPGLREILPPTDTRFRPDQRALEQGEVEAAERHKLALEQAQRERRRDPPAPDHHHKPYWFRKVTQGDEELWVFTGEYWKAREAGFNTEQLPRIW